MIAAPSAPDHFPPLLLRDTGGGQSDDDGVVTGQDQIDGDDLPENHELRPDA